MLDDGTAGSPDIISVYLKILGKIDTKACLVPKDSRPMHCPCSAVRFLRYDHGMRTAGG